MAKSDDVKTMAETLSTLVSRHGLATILALTLVGQLIYSNHQNMSKLEAMNTSQADIARSLQLISQSQAETAKLLEKLAARIEAGH